MFFNCFKYKNACVEVFFLTKLLSYFDKFYWIWHQCSLKAGAGQKMKSGCECTMHPPPPPPPNSNYDKSPWYLLGFLIFGCIVFDEKGNNMFSSGKNMVCKLFYSFFTVDNITT